MADLVDPETLVVARPHFRQTGNELRFFLSERAYHFLSPAESQVWERLKRGPLVWKDLPDEAATRSLAELRVVELIQPVRETERRQILVVEPHCDDAALSIGATMWKRRLEVEFHVLTMASRSNYTTAFQLHRDFFNRAEVTAMRTSEGELFARHLGAHYYYAGKAEATLRYNDSDWTLDFFKAHEVPIAISNNRRAPADVLESWTKYLSKFLAGRAFEEIWIPLGAGNHSDHDLTRSAALQAIVDNPPKAVVRFYEDVPYGVKFQEHKGRLLRVLEDAGAKLSSWSQDVTREFASKLLLLEIFASQFKVPSVLPGLESSAGAADGSTRVEHLWTLQALPGQLPKNQMWVGAPEIARARVELNKFLKGSSSAKRIVIFAIGASGRWAEDFSVLSNLFPRARFVIYAGPKVCAEFLALIDPRVDVHCLDGSATAWVNAALREVPSAYRIIIAGPALAKAKLLMSVWTFGRKIAVCGMDQITDGLAEP